ncbi:MAG: DoxX family protein [Flavobacteriales bacterium]|nr:MAG: DoxX family protein [Flavobacteriales bacterium]
MYATEILLLLFLVITFIQSGLDKLIDWKGNLSWLKGHFAKTSLSQVVPVMLAIVLISELLSGILSMIGIWDIIINGNTTVAFYGAILSCLSLLMLLLGQRIAKDYQGAQTLVIYFIPAIFLVFLLQA